MTQPRVEHLAIKTDRAAAGTGAHGFWPPLPVGLWLPPAASLFVLAAALLALCLSGTQAAQPGVGWLEPREAPLLLSWLIACAAVFLAPQLSRTTAMPAAAPPVPAADPCASAPAAAGEPVLAGGWKILLQAAAVGLPVAGVAWAFQAVASLLDTDAANRLAAAVAQGSWAAAWPAGLAGALAAGAVCALAWLWLCSAPRLGIVLLAAWSGLPPLTWFLAVDVLGRDTASFPPLLTVNPVYALVLLARDPARLAWWSIPALLGCLAAAPAALALANRLRRPRASALAAG